MIAKVIPRYLLYQHIMQAFVTLPPTLLSICARLLPGLAITRQTLVWAYLRGKDQVYYGKSILASCYKTNLDFNL